MKTELKTGGKNKWKTGEQGENRGTVNTSHRRGMGKEKLRV